MLEDSVSPPKNTGCREGFICSRIKAEITLGILTPAPSPTTNAKVHRLNHDNRLENLRSMKIPNIEGMINEYCGFFSAAAENNGTISGSYKSGFKKLYHVMIMV